MVRERERIHLFVLDALQDLTTYKIEQGSYKAGLAHATRLLELDPLLESGHRQMMRLLAFSGQRAAALAQYKTCSAILKNELGIEPEATTSALVQAIKNGELTVPSKTWDKSAIQPTPPSFLLDPDAKPTTKRPVFVAREAELAHLFGLLEKMLTGHGQVAMIVGEAGSGKTSLVHEFTRQAMDSFPELLVGLGTCSAHTRIGEPFLPFREVLRMLMGDVQAPWTKSILSQAHVKRIWDQSLQTIRTLLDHGPDLVNSLISSKEIRRFIKTAPAKITKSLTPLISDIEAKSSYASTLEMAPLISQYTKFLHAKSNTNPLLLILDDLQWIDSASIDQLFHLGHRLESQRILIVCVYRPEDLSQSEPTALQLQDVIAEFKRRFGNITVDLDRASHKARQHFINQFIDSEPNKLDAKFRNTFFAHTDGHALFTVEMLRDLQERHDLVVNAKGYWIENRVTDWSNIPARIEGVIEARINRLNPSQFALLQAASVEGERFSAQIIANAVDQNQAITLKMLTAELDRHHQLIFEDSVEAINNQQMYRFRFRHSLFHAYLYSTISDVTRKILHGKIGTNLEEIYKSQIESVVGKLAQHFDQAGFTKKAIKYAILAGDQSRRLGASAEAIKYYEQARAMTKDEGQIGDASLAVSIHEKLGDVYRINLSNHGMALHCYKELLTLSGAPQQKATALRKIASVLHLQGDIDQAQDHYFQALTLLGKSQSHQESIGTHCGLSSIYLEKNKIQEAEQHALQALDLAKQLKVKPGEANAYRNLGSIAYEKGDMQASCDYGMLSLELYREIGDLTRVAQATNNVGETQFLLGNVSEAFEILKEGMHIANRIGLSREETFLLNTFSQLLIEIGDWAAARDLIKKALPLAYQSAEATSLILVHWTLGRAELGLQAYQAANDNLDQAIKFSQDNQIERFLPWIYLSFSQLRTYQDDYEASFEYLSLIEPFIAAGASDWMTAKYHRYFGLLHHSCKRYAEAIRSLSEVSGTSHNLIPPIENAKTRYHLANSLVARGQNQDLDIAQQELHQAKDIFSTFEASVYEEKVEEVLRKIHA